MCYAKWMSATRTRHFSANCVKTGNMWTVLENVKDQIVHYMKLW